MTNFCDPHDAILQIKPALYEDCIRILYTDEEKFFEIDDQIS